MSTSPVHPIQVPNRFFEGKTTVYLIASRPVTLIDTGVATDGAFDVLCTGLQGFGVGVAEIGRVVLTHKHIDHIGNAWRIQRQSGAEILIHQNELDAVTEVDQQGHRFLAVVSQKLDDWGVPASMRPSGSPSLVPDWRIESAKATGLVDGQRIALDGDDLEVIHTPGHTVGSICLKYGEYLFSGDHVLPDISPNIGGGDLKHRGLLRMFLASLGKTRNLATGLKVMPGHGQPFINLAERCDQLLEHHAERLRQIRGILRQGPQTVYQIAGQLFGEMPGFHIVLGCAEANAHLELLLEQGDVRANREKYHLADSEGEG